MADAKLDKTGVPQIGTQAAIELPGSYRPDRQPAGSALVVATPALAPDMNSEAVRAASPSEAQTAEKVAAETVAKAEIKPAPKKVRVARKPLSEPGEQQPHVAWRNNDPGFGGGGLFGRF